MDAKTTAAVANLRAALQDYPRGTRKFVPRKKGAHEMWGALVPVVKSDAAAACEAVPAEQRTKTVSALAAALAKLPDETSGETGLVPLIVTLEADAVFELLDLLPKDQP